MNFRENKIYYVIHLTTIITTKNNNNEKQAQAIIKIPQKKILNKIVVVAFSLFYFKNE